MAGSPPSAVENMCLTLWEPLRSERGQTLPIVAVMMVAVLSIMALAIDLAQAYTARAELQRMVDASSLAGASAFIDFQGTPTEGYARTRAEEYVALNRVRGATPDSALARSSRISADASPGRMRLPP